MRIVTLTKETTENILENMLKRSPSQYGEYESRVQEIIAQVKKKRMRLYFPIQSSLTMHNWMLLIFG